MTAIVSYRLKCDGCDSAYSAAPDVSWDLRSVRAAARKLGWSRSFTSIPSGDYCSRCADRSAGKRYPLDEE